MGGVYGITQLKKILAVIIEVGNVADRVINDKSVGYFKKLGYAFQLYDELGMLFTLNVANLREEIKELDEGDRKDLKDFVKAKFNILEKDIEAKIESALDLVEHAGEFVDKILLFIKGLRK